MAAPLVSNGRKPLRRRLVVVAGAAALTMVAGLLAARARAGAAPRDALDWPERLAVSPAAHVYVAMGTDTLVGAVVELSASLGVVVRRWAMVETIDDIAVAKDGRVYVLLSESNRVERYVGDGTPDGGWQLTIEGLTLATGPWAESTAGAVYVLGNSTSGAGTPGVTRFAASGAPLATFPVADAAYDLTVGAADQAPDGLVYVANDSTSAGTGRSQLARHLSDGTIRDPWLMRGAVYGLGTDAEGRVSVAVAPAGSQARWVDRFDADGKAAGGWQLPAGDVRDLAVDSRLGDVYVIVNDEVLRYSAAGVLLDHYSQEKLNQYPVTETPPAFATTTPITATGTPPTTTTPTAHPPTVTSTPTAPILPTIALTPTPTAQPTPRPVVLPALHVSGRP